MSDNDLIHRGDIVGVRGFAGKSLKGELSIYALELKLLTPCLRFLPKLAFGLTDPEIRARKRYFDLIANHDVREVFITKSKIFGQIRKYLDDRGFIEVHTPILSLNAGGASAKPFVTHHNDLDQSMFLRIAPELYLKQLVVGGLNRVYELGPQFRNESIDPSHNPEFSSLEFYMAYADYNDLFTMCEELFATIVSAIHGTLKVKYKPLNRDEITIDFTPPYRRLDMIPELERRTGTAFPKDLSSDSTREFLDDLCTTLHVECGAPRTTARLIDKLVSHFIEPDCQNPTFIMNQPLVMSPLAKQHRDFPQLTERFELFIAGMELANAYTELNDPQIQRLRFEEQAKAKNLGDDEAQTIDEPFLDSLEYGLPPTGGFGLGIERLDMLMTNRNTIRDVITFPPVTDKIKKVDNLSLSK
jgi:lysyl-tRNA synthetase class 2